jgi:hypothetical protein
MHGYNIIPVSATMEILGKGFLLSRIELAKKFVLENGSPEEHNEFYRVAGINRKQ